MNSETSKQGETPAVGLVNPKFPHNVGGALRACSCFGAAQLWFSGDRVPLTQYKGYRLPREERMKGFRNVKLTHDDHFLDQFDRETTVVGIELLPETELLTYFEHPEKAVYVFGPEDGSLPKSVRIHCHRFVVIPTRHCVNLAAAVYLTLYDRQLKRQLHGDEPVVPVEEMLAEHRGFIAGSDP